LTLQLTESAMFGTGQAYPFTFWVIVAAGAALGEAGSSAGDDDNEAGRRRARSPGVVPVP
jgi:hypothetical protein